MNLENIINRTISKAKNGLKKALFAGGLLGVLAFGGAKEARGFEHFPPPSYNPLVFTFDGGNHDWWSIWSLPSGWGGNISLADWNWTDYEYYTRFHYSYGAWAGYGREEGYSAGMSYAFDIAARVFGGEDDSQKNILTFGTPGVEVGISPSQLEVKTDSTTTIIPTNNNYFHIFSVKYSNLGTLRVLVDGEIKMVESLSTSPRPGSYGSYIFDWSYHVSPYSDYPAADIGHMQMNIGTTDLPYIDPKTIPEPATIALLGLGAGYLIARRKDK